MRSVADVHVPAEHADLPADPRVIEARLKAVTDARELAQSAAERATAATTEYIAETQRGAVRGLSADGREAAGRARQRAALLGETRATVERELQDATRRVKQQAAEARATLDREADALAAPLSRASSGRAS